MMLRPSLINVPGCRDAVVLVDGVGVMRCLGGGGAALGVEAVGLDLLKADGEVPLRRGRWRRLC